LVKPSPTTHLYWLLMTLNIILRLWKKLLCSWIEWKLQ